MRNILQNFNIERLRRNLKFQIFVSLMAVLFFIKIIFDGNTSTISFVAGEVIVILSVISLTLYIIELHQHRKLNPLSLVMNVGILSGIFFFITTFSEGIINFLFSSALEEGTQQGLIQKGIHYVYAAFLIAVFSYLFIVFRELYFHKKKKTSNLYFNTMVVFFLLSMASAGLSKVPDLDFISTTFFSVTVILITLNSIKISWIAFLTKKQKLSLLAFSVLISFLFIVNLTSNSDAALHSRMLINFSPALHQFINIILLYGIIYFSVLFFTTLFHLPTAEAYDRKAREISSLQYFSSLINQVLDFNELEDTITDLALKVSNADSSWIVWYKDGKLKTSAHKKIGFLDADAISDFVLKNYSEEKFSGTTLVNLEKLSAQMDFQNKYSYAAVSGLRTCNDAHGFLFITLNSETVFDDEDISAINTFADYSSIAVENCRLLKENIEKERLEKELDVAREVQRKILPFENPHFPELSISSVFIPAFEVGGDYYDFFRFGNSKLGFVIADVSGKGISAAFIMAEIKGIFESLSRILVSPREILIKANEILKDTLDRRNFVSAAYGIIDIENQKLIIARAGHCPVLLLRDNKAIQIRPGGLGLGLNYSEYFAETLGETEIDLKENDTIVLYTDGITEAKNSELNDFGSKKFERILLENNTSTAEEISSRVIKEVTLFSKSISQHDDITLVILKWKQKNKSNGEKEWQNSVQQSKITVI